MSEELKPEDQIKALQKEVQELKDQLFVLNDKASQALIALESQSGVVLGLVAMSKNRPELLARYLSYCRQVDASPINKKRTDFELQYKSMIRELTVEHLKAK
jgi:hypothetical protein